MERGNILQMIEVMDDSLRIRPRFRPQGSCIWAPDGRYLVLREDGKLLLEITYRDGLVHGPYVAFWPNGNTATEGQYYEGKQEGLWHFYNEDGTISNIIRFKQDVEVSSDLYLYNADGTPRDIISLDEFKQRNDLREGKRERKGDGGEGKRDGSNLTIEDDGQRS
jgi:antitoxin component YwqK of YwqJK toxin-antitoxin module